SLCPGTTTRGVFDETNYWRSDDSGDRCTRAAGPSVVPGACAAADWRCARDRSLGTDFSAARRTACGAADFRYSLPPACCRDLGTALRVRPGGRTHVRLGARNVRSAH